VAACRIASRLRALRPDRRSYATIIGLAAYGLGIAIAGLLRADPAEGFPLGTPAGPPVVVTASGVGHLVAGGISFLGLIVACVACGRRSAQTGDRAWAACSAAIGVYYLVAFAGIASGGRESRDQHCLHDRCRAGLGMVDGSVHAGAQGTNLLSASTLTLR